MNVSYSLLVIGSIASGTFKLWITEFCIMVRISNYCHVWLTTCKYDIFQNSLAKITSGSSMACKVFTSPPCGLNLPGCLIRRGYFVLSTAPIFVWIAPGFLSTRDTRKCIKRFPNLVVFYKAYSQFIGF